MQIFVTGSDGQLGKALERSLRRLDGIKYFMLSKNDLDITNADAVDSLFSKAGRNSVVINCAAYTDVEKAEDEPEKAFLINETGAKNIASASVRYGLKLIHISTDFVFNGEKGSPYNENDLPDPLSVYGKSKYAGEKAVLGVCDEFAVVRTSWLYSTTHKTFLNKIIEKARQVPVLKVVSDETGSPTYSNDLASALIDIALKIIRGKNRFSGIYHYCNSGSVSRLEYARRIIELSGLKAQVLPVLSSEFQMKARRPENSSLDNKKIVKEFGLSIRSWEKALEEAVGEL